jgi:chaperonin cofactor prefoldin
MARLISYQEFLKGHLMDIDAELRRGQLQNLECGELKGDEALKLIGTVLFNLVPHVKYLNEYLDRLNNSDTKNARHVDELFTKVKELEGKFEVAARRMEGYQGEFQRLRRHIRRAGNGEE